MTFWATDLKTEVLSRSWRIILCSRRPTRRTLILIRIGISHSLLELHLIHISKRWKSKQKKIPLRCTSPMIPTTKMGCALRTNLIKRSLRWTMGSRSRKRQSRSWLVDLTSWSPRPFRWVSFLMTRDLSLSTTDVIWPRGRLVSTSTPKMLSKQCARSTTTRLRTSETKTSCWETIIWGRSFTSKISKATRSRSLRIMSNSWTLIRNPRY